MAFVCQVTLKDHVIKALTFSRLWAELSAPTNFLLLFIYRPVFQPITEGILFFKLFNCF